MKFWFFYSLFYRYLHAVETLDSVLSRSRCFVIRLMYVCVFVCVLYIERQLSLVSSHKFIYLSLYILCTVREPTILAIGNTGQCVLLVGIRNIRIRR